MEFLHCFGFFLVALAYKVVQAQCVIRTIVPMAMMESCSSGSCTCDDSSSDDLSALLLLARALEMDRANYANNGVDVNGLLNNLINALVYTATHNSGTGNSNRNTWSGTSSGSGSNKNNEGLIDLNLLGSGKDNVASLELSGNKILGLGLGGSNSPSSGNSDTLGENGLLGGVTGALGGVTGAVEGLTGGGGNGGLLSDLSL